MWHKLPSVSPFVWKSFSKSARLFLITTVLFGLFLSIWQLIFNLYILASGHNNEFLGLINSIYAVTSLVMSVPLGMLPDRVGQRKSMLLGLTVMSLGLGLMVMVKHPSMILVTAFWSGMGNTLFMVSLYPFMMGVSFDKNRAALFSMHFALMTAAGVAGNILAGQLSGIVASITGIPEKNAQVYQAVLFFAIMMCILAALPIFLVKEKVIKHIQTLSTLPGLLKILKNKIVWKLSLPNLLQNMGVSLLFPYMNVYFVEQFGIESQPLGVIFGLVAFFAGASSLLGPLIEHIFGGKIRAIVINQGLSLIFLMLTGFTPLVWFAASSLIIHSILNKSTEPLFAAFSMEQIPSNQLGFVNSIQRLFMASGQMIGSYLFSILQTRYGFQPLFFITAIFFGLSSGFVWLFFKNQDRANLLTTFAE